jgi:hypothetical protein
MNIDLEAHPVKGQLASAVLDLKGKIISMSSSTTDDNAGATMWMNDITIIFQMLLEAGTLLLQDVEVDDANNNNKDNFFRRIAISFPSVQYVCDEIALSFPYCSLQIVIIRDFYGLSIYVCVITVNWYQLIHIEKRQSVDDNNGHAS